MKLTFILQKLKLGFEFNGMYWHSDEVVYKKFKR